MAYHGQQAYQSHQQGQQQAHMSAMDPAAAAAAAAAGGYTPGQIQSHPMTAMVSNVPMSGAMYAPHPGQAMYPGIVAADGYSQTAMDPSTGAYWQLPPAPRLPVAAARGWGGVGGYHYPQSGLAGYQGYAHGGTWATPQQHQQQLAIAAQHAEAEQALLQQQQQQQMAQYGHAQQGPLAPITSQPIQTSQSQIAMSMAAPGYYPTSMAPAPSSDAVYPGDVSYGGPHQMTSAPFAHESRNIQQVHPRHQDHHQGLGPAAQIRSRSTHDYGRNSADGTRSQRLPSLHELDWRSHHQQQPRQGRLSNGHQSAGWPSQYVQGNARQRGTRSYDCTWQQEQQQNFQQHQQHQRTMHEQERVDRSSEWRSQSMSAAQSRKGAADIQATQKIDEATAQPIAAAAEDDTNKGPAPPSPATLDKSGVPISAFGAELIWYACATLLEPELVQEAYMEQSLSAHATSPSSGSATSSPSLSTPTTSPHSPHLLAKDSDMPSFAAFGNGHFDENLFALKKGDHQQKRTRVGTGRSSSSSSRESSGPGTPSPDGEAARHASAAAHLLALQDQRPSLRDGSPMCISSPTSTATGPGKRGPLLFRTKSQERSKTAVLSVLALVSPYWKWTRAAEALPSLVQTAAATAKNARKTKQGEHNSPTSPREHAASSASASFAAGGEVSPAFRRFAHQVLAQTLLSPTAFLLGLLFALRVPYLAVDTSGNVDHEAVELLASPPSAAPFKLLTLGLMMANKHLDDNTFLNKTWSEVTGIPLIELNKLEQYYLIRCNYEIAIPHSVWCSFLKRVKRREEDKTAGVPEAGRGAQYHRESSPRATSSISQRETSQRVLLALDDMLSALGSRVIEHLDLEGEERRVEHKKRPTAGLMVQHQHHQSAPASASLFKDGLERREQRPSLDTRSWSDDVACGTAAAAAAAATASSSLNTDHNAPLAPSALLELLNSGRSLASAH